MLKCDHCEYDLTSLVRGPEVVTCPECGRAIQHIDGRPMRPRSAFRTLGPSKWVIVALPAICMLPLAIVMVAILLWPDRLFDSSFSVAKSLMWMSLALHVGAWMWPFALSRRHGFTWDERFSAGLTMGSLALAAYIMLLLAGYLILRLYLLLTT